MSTFANLVVEITARTSALTSNLAAGQTKIANFAKSAAASLAKIGTITVAAVAASVFVVERLFSSTALKIDEVSKAAQKLQIPIAELQKIEFAGALANITDDTIVRALQFLGKNIFEAATKGGEAALIFNRLGLNLKTLNLESADKQFRSIADALQKVTNAGERNNIQMALFGRGGLEVTNLLNESLKESDALFARLGLGITDSQGKMVEAFNDSQTVLGKIWEGFKIKVVAEAAPAFLKITEKITDLIVEAGGIDVVASKVALSFVSMAKTSITAISNIVLFVKELEVRLAALDIVNKSIIAGAQRLGRTLAKNVLKEEKRQATGPLLTGAIFPIISTIKDFLNPTGEELDQEFKVIHPAFEKLEKTATDYVKTQTDLTRIADALKEAMSGAAEKTNSLGVSAAAAASIFRPGSVKPPNLGASPAPAALAGVMTPADQSAFAALDQTLAKMKELRLASEAAVIAYNQAKFGRNTMTDLNAQTDIFGHTSASNLMGTVAENKPMARVALDVNITADKDGNLVAVVQKGPVRAAVENIILDMVVGTSKTFASTKAF